MNKKIIGLIIGIIVIIIAAGVGGGWYWYQHRTVAPDGGTPDSNGDDNAVVDPAAEDPEGLAGVFFARNREVNAEVLASLKPGGSGDRVETKQTKTVALRGTVVTPDKIIDDGIVVVEYAEQDMGGRSGGSRLVGTIAAVREYSSDAVPAGATLVDFTGSCIYPGFIDMHNHVHYNAFDLWKPTFDIFPNRDVWGKDPRYSDWKTLNKYFAKEWTNQVTEVTKFGEIRGLLCGETTMQGFQGDFGGSYGLCRNIENSGNLFGEDRINQSVLPVSGWYRGNRSEAAREKVLSAFESGRAKRYIMHLCEGIDDKIHDEFVQLKSFNLIREEMVGIHSTALRGDDWDAIAAARQKVVWSPLSNLILYNQTTDIAGALEHGVPLRNISFAPDWAPSGTPGMFYELKVVAEYNQDAMNGVLTPQNMVEMMTINPANISSYTEYIGELKVGLRADITIVKKGSGDPYESLIAAKLEDINLVMVDGQPLYGTLSFYTQFAKGNDYEIFDMNGVEKAIDITEEGIDKGDQTLRELMELLNTSFDYISREVPFEFRRDRSAYARLAPLFWPETISYKELMYLSVLGKGSTYAPRSSDFRNSEYYQDRDATARDRVKELMAQAKAERPASSRGSSSSRRNGGSSSSSGSSDEGGE